MSDMSAYFGGGFKADEVEIQENEFEPLPKDNYDVKIMGEEIKPLKSGKGTGLTLKLEVQGGEYNKRILFDLLCIQHENETAQRIAHEKLAKLCKSVGISKLIDSSELVDKTCVAVVSQRDNTYNGETTVVNQINSYEQSPNYIKDDYPANMLKNQAKPKTPEPVADGSLEDEIPF
jgi:hypothetical protein